MFTYAKDLALADMYSDGLGAGQIYTFCKIPLLLAHATLHAIETGEEKLTRQDVIKLVNEVDKRRPKSNVKCVKIA